MQNKIVVQNFTKFHLIVHSLQHQMNGSLRIDQQKVNPVLDPLIPEDDHFAALSFD